jgi:monofunctional biosynthetic peptidoglycan transglycosylase
MRIVRPSRRTLLRIALALVALPLLLALWTWAGLPRRVKIAELAKAFPEKTAVMRQREEEAKDDGKTLRLRYRPVPISRISRNLIHAVVTAEDAKFFGHEGVDWEAVQQSWEKNWKEKRLARGGSTITQQLAKNLYFSTRKDPVRKVRELFVAGWLEEDLSKRRILELYLNVIEWGDGIFGAEAAAQAWYGRSASALDEVQAAGLAAMIPNPRRINPRVAPKSHARRARRILWQMARAGYAKRSLGMGAEPPPETEVEPEPEEPSQPATPEPTPLPSEEPEAPAPEATQEPPAETTPEPPAPEPSPSG